MSKKFSNLVEKIKPSFTLQMTARAAELRAQGEDVINFGVGEPDFNTPDHIIEAGKKAMVDGYTKYTPGSGMLELKEAIQTKLKDLTGINYNPENIIVSNGGKQSLSVVCQALFDSGDKVVVFSPYWVSFPEFVTIAGAEPLFVNTIPTKQFEPDFDDLLNKIDESVKGVIINSPSNPTGGVWSDDAIIKLLKLSKENNWIVISDETYEELVYDNEFKAIETLDKHNCEIITIRSMSKTYAMTGWRIGYTTADRDIVKAMSKIQGQTTSCPNAIGQRASIAALETKSEWLPGLLKTATHNQSLIKKTVDKIDGVELPVYPSAASMMVIDISKHNANPQDVQDKLLYENDIFVRAGNYVSERFGDNFIHRLMYECQ